MHEFSLAAEVVKLAREEAGKNNARSVSEITIEVGSISGVETEAFRSALSLLTEGTLLENARLNIVTINAIGICVACKHDFEMEQRMEICPICGSFPSEIRGGKEFRVVSLVIEEEDKNK